MLAAPHGHGLQAPRHAPAINHVCPPWPAMRPNTLLAWHVAGAVMVAVLMSAPEGPVVKVAVAPILVALLPPPQSTTHASVVQWGARAQGGGSSLALAAWQHDSTPSFMSAHKDARQLVSRATAVAAAISAPSCIACSRLHMPIAQLTRHAWCADTGRCCPVERDHIARADVETASTTDDR